MENNIEQREEIIRIKEMKLLLLLKSKPQQAAFKGTISWGVQEKRKERKTQKSRSEEKVVGFSSASLFPTRKWKPVTQGGTI